MPRTQLELQCALLGFNDTFAEECELILSAFRRVSPSLRNACIRIVASRHSLYVGKDETATRAVDLKRIRLSPYLQAQLPPDPFKYVRRLCARLGRPELLPDCTHIITNMQWYAPFLCAREMAIASLIIADEQMPLGLLSEMTGVSELYIARLVASALDVPLPMACRILRPARTSQHILPTHHINVQPTLFQPAQGP